MSDQPEPARGRGRPKGVKNKPREETAMADGETPAVEATEGGQPQARTTKREKRRTEDPVPRKGHNGPTPEARAQFLAKMLELEGRKQRISGLMSALKTDVEAAGGNWAGLKMQFKLMKMLEDDEPAATALVDDIMAGALQAGVKITWVADQATFADFMEANQPPPKNTEGTRDLSEARAHGDGYNSGKAGAVPGDNPHHAGTAEYVSWEKGRADGQLDLELRTPGMADRLEASRQADGSIPDETPAMPDDDFEASAEGSAPRGSFH